MNRLQLRWSQLSTTRPRDAADVLHEGLSMLHAMHAPPPAWEPPAGFQKQNVTRKLELRNWGGLLKVQITVASA